MILSLSLSVLCSASSKKFYVQEDVFSQIYLFCSVLDTKATCYKLSKATSALLEMNFKMVVNVTIFRKKWMQESTVVANAQEFLECRKSACKI